MIELDDLIAKVLNGRSNYLIDSLLGDGKLGRVYKAIAIDANTDDESGLSYRAIEFIPIDIQDNPEAKTRFQRVMPDYLIIQDRDIVQVLDYGCFTLNLEDNLTEDFLFVVMEFIEASIGNLPLPFAPELYVSAALEIIIIGCLESPEDMEESPQGFLTSEEDRSQEARAKSVNPNRSSLIANRNSSKRSRHKSKRKTSVKTYLILSGSLITLAVLWWQVGINPFAKKQALNSSDVSITLEPTQSQLISSSSTLPEPILNTQIQSNQANVSSSQSNNNSSVLPVNPLPNNLHSQPVSDRPNIPITITNISNFKTIPISNSVSEPLPKVEVAEGDSSADTKELKITLEAYSSRSYAILTTKAESLASSAIAQEFANSPQLDTISLMVFGDRKGQLAPILSVNVSRSQWQSDPRVQAWANYVLKSEVLLGYALPQVPKPPQSKPNSASTSSPSPKPISSLSTSPSVSIGSDSETSTPINRNTPSNFKNKPDSSFSDD